MIVLVVVIVTGSGGPPPAPGGAPGAAPGVAIPSPSYSPTPSPTTVTVPPPPTPPPSSGSLPTSVLVTSLRATPGVALAADFATRFRADVASAIAVDPSMITMPTVTNTGNGAHELAQFRPAFSSSIYGDGTASPRKAVDGNTIAYYPNIFQSADPGPRDTLPEWFAVMLEAPTTNPDVTLWARDCCTDSFSNELTVSIGTWDGSDGSDGSLAAATSCGVIQMANSGTQSMSCRGSGNMIYISAARGGPVQLAEMSVAGVLNTVSVVVNFNVAVAADRIDTVRDALSLMQFGSSAAAIAAGTSASIMGHDIVRYSGQFSCATALDGCPTNSNCVDNVADGYYCECALDFSGARPACAAGGGGSTGGPVSGGSSGTIAMGSHVLLQTMGNTYVRASASGAIDQVSVPAAGLPDDWLFETFTIRDAGQGTVALQTYHNTFVHATRDSQIQQTSAVPPEALTLNDPDALPDHWDWCRFTIVPAGDGQIAFLTYHNTFLRAPNGATIDQSSPAPGSASQGLPASWQQERFVVSVLDAADLLVPIGRVVTISAPTGSYMCAAPAAASGIGSMVVSSATPPGDDCQFTVIGVAGGRVSLQTSSGSYVRGTSAGRTHVDHATNARDLGLMHWFTVVDAGNGAMGLQTARGTYISVTTGAVTETSSLARLTATDVGSPSQCGTVRQRPSCFCLWNCFNPYIYLTSSVWITSDVPNLCAVCLD